MHRSIALVIVASLAGMSAAMAPQALAQSSASATPDFSGVYYPVQQGRGGGRGPRAGGPPASTPARPTQSAPVSDGSQGRSPDAPALTPEYMAKWEVIRKSRMSGSYEYDNNAKCLPPGMPAMMNMAYGMEVMQTRDKITFFSELNDALRRVYLDGRKPTQKHLDDATYAGYSTGRWEGDTLFIEGFSPHSDQMVVRERIRFAGPGLLEDRITVTDPKALIKPWETVRTYRKANKGNDELREFACAEGLTREK